MHGFWRAAVAVAVGSVLGWLLAILLWDVTGIVVAVRDLYGPVVGGICLFTPASLCGVGAYGLLTHRYGPKVINGETRCRKCGYILKGLSEPRCSECGERI